MKNISSSPRWLWKGHERLPGGTMSYEYPRSFAPRSGPMRTASLSNLSPFSKCSSFNWSMLMTLESITLIGPPRLRPHWPIRPLRCPQRGPSALRGGVASRDPAACKANSRLGAALQRSSVDIPEDDVLRADDRDHVRDHVSARHLVQRGQVCEVGRAQLQPVRFVGAVRNDVDAELALRMLDRGIRLARWHVYSLSEELEVMDQLFHVRLHLFARRRRHLVVCGDHRPGVLA